MTRITESMTSARVLADIQAVSERLSLTQARISSGKQITKPSDDPFGAGRALQLRADSAQTSQYRRNVDEANSWQTVADTTLSNISDAVKRANELIVQGSTGTVSPQGRQAIAAELGQLLEQIKSDANAQYAGRYIFAGTKTTTQPYTPGASDAYNGDTNPVTREIGPGVQVQVNSIGSAIFGDQNGGLLKTLRDAIADLNSGNQAALSTTDLHNLGLADDTLTNERAVVGARASRLDAAGGRLDEMLGVNEKLLSSTEDADLAQTAIDFSTQQAVYTAALRAGAQLIQPSLLDFLTQ
jgi:flagellar hook-associated protein 3 FlgL